MKASFVHAIAGCRVEQTRWELSETTLKLVVCRNRALVARWTGNHRLLGPSWEGKKRKKEGEETRTPVGNRGTKLAEERQSRAEDGRGGEGPGVLKRKVGGS